MLLYRKGGKLDGRSELPQWLIDYGVSSDAEIKNGKVFGLNKPSHLIEGFSMGADANGFFIYTHRARSKSRMNTNFTEKEQKFIESTG
jgi:hypothetical protein